MKTTRKLVDGTVSCTYRRGDVNLAIVGILVELEPVLSNDSADFFRIQDKHDGAKDRFLWDIPHTGQAEQLKGSPCIALAEFSSVGDKRRRPSKLSR